MKKTWKGSENIISLKTLNQTFPNAIIDNNATSTDPITIANAFHKCFSTIAIDIKTSIIYSKKQIFNFLPLTNTDSFFISSIDCNKISNIISFLNNHKSVGPNSIPTKILKLLKRIYLIHWPLSLTVTFV